MLPAAAVLTLTLLQSKAGIDAGPVEGAVKETRKQSQHVYIMQPYPV